MADSVEFLGNVAEQMAQQTAEHFGEIASAVTAGGVVVESLRGIREAQHGGDGQLPATSDAEYKLAQQLALIANGSVALLREMATSAMVTVEGISDIGAFEVTAGQLALEAGEPVDDGQDNEVPSPVEELEDQVSEVARHNQEKVLNDFTENDRVEEVEALSQAEMVYLGAMLKQLYLNLQVGARGIETQPVRAQQFEDVLHGIEPEELEVKYGQSINTIKVALRTAVTKTLPNNGVGPNKKIEIFDKAVQAFRARA